MNRNDVLDQFRDSEIWDMVVVGGGATGLGTAVDAASRGYRVALCEQADFAKGTSSRATKLIHGGVRYLQQGNLRLVTDALQERSRLIDNAPHLVSALRFVVPSYRWWESAYYGMGLRLYDSLAGAHRLGSSRHLSRHETLAAVPTLRSDTLRGGTQYFDALFDDARLALCLAKTAANLGAAVANYAQVVEIVDSGKPSTTKVVVEDQEGGERFELRSRIVVNATGPFSDAVRQMIDPNVEPIIQASRGAHLVVDAAFLPGDAAMLIPKTDDGRVLFAIPWCGATLIGTTDVAIDHVDLEPTVSDDELDFLLSTANRYLSRPIKTKDIRSLFAGIRPLVRAKAGKGTAALSRDHTVLVDESKRLLTVAGGKWTTYRKMAEDVVSRAADLAGLPRRKCTTADLRLHGSEGSRVTSGALASYGSDADLIREEMRSDPSLAQRASESLPLSIGEIKWACNNEMAITVDDMLARRSRWLILDASAAADAAERVAQVMSETLGRDEDWIANQTRDFRALATNYLPNI